MDSNMVISEADKIGGLPWEPQMPKECRNIPYDVSTPMYGAFLLSVSKPEWACTLKGQK